MRKSIIIFGLVFLLFASFVSAVNYGVEAGSIARYNFSDNVANDYGADGTGNSAAYSANYPFFAIENNGTPKSFDCTGANWIDHNAAINESKGFAWFINFNPDVLGSYQRIINSNEDDYYLQLRGDTNKTRFVSAAFGIDINSNNAAIIGSWHSVVIKVNSTEASMWINGTKQTEVDTSFSLSDGGDIDICRRTSASEYFNGQIDSLVMVEGDILESQIQNYFDYGWINISSDLSELTLINAYNSTAINNFTAEITNATSSHNITTTNGSIFWNPNDLINISYFNVSGNTYFNQSYTEINTSSNFIGETYQAIVYTYSQDAFNLSNIENFNITLGTSFNTSQNNYTISYVNAGNYNYTALAENYQFNSTGNITLNALEILNQTINFTKYVFYINATDRLTNNAIPKINVTIRGITYETTGTLTFSTASDLLNISISSAGFLSNIKLNHNTSQNLTLNLSNSTNFLYFINANNDSAISNATINIKYPSGTTISRVTDNAGKINFSSIRNTIEELGNYTITFLGKEGYISPITFYENLSISNAPFNNTYNISRVNIIINIYDRETHEILNKTSYLNILGFLNSSTNNGTLILSNLSIFSGDYTFQVVSEGYSTEEKTVIFTNKENLTLDFYLLNLTGDNTGTLFYTIIDQYYRLTKDSLVNLYEYFPETMSYEKVSECNSNVNGECTFFIELGIKKYYVTASKTISGQVYTDHSTEEIINTDNEVRILRLIPSYSINYFDSDNIFFHYIDEYFNNESNISSINISFSTFDGSVIELCLRFVDEDYNEEYAQCSITSSGIITSLFLLNRNETHRAQIFINKTSGLIEPLKEFTYLKVTGFSNYLNENNYSKYIIFGSLVLIAAFLIISGNATLGVVIFIVAIWAQYNFFPDTTTIKSTVLKTFLLLILLSITRKKEDKP
ncbi:MAG: hypothetical protein ACFFDN_01370 [Candidatus Hodarchaeota archaeon]